MKLKRIFIIISILIAFVAHSQEDVNNKGEKTKIRGINEISYQFPMAIGYYHIRNFNDKILLGAGMHLGYGGYYSPQYSDFFFFKLYARNLFSKSKFNKRIDYDIGLFTSVSSIFEVVFYGVTTAGYINIYKFKIGLNCLFGAYNYYDETFFPGFTIAPLILFNF